jgi:hypothetical protein
MAYQADKYPDEIHLYAASLENAGDFAPEFHSHVDEMLPWIHLSNGLPKL